MHEEQSYREATCADACITLNPLQPWYLLVWLSTARLWPVSLSFSSLESFPLSSFSMTSYVPASFLENCNIVMIKPVFRTGTVEKYRFYLWTQLISCLSPAGTWCLRLPLCPSAALLLAGVLGWALAGGPGVQDLVLPQICCKAGYEPDPSDDSESLSDKHFPNAIQNRNVVSICC